MKLKSLLSVLYVSFLSIMAGLPSCVLAQTSSSEPIKIGMTTSLSGLNAAFGLSTRNGIEAYFNKINAEGGIGGHQIELVALDDGYEPARAASNMLQLIDKENVLAVIGNAGTSTAAVTVPIADKKKVLLFGPLSGSDILRKNPPDRYVINFRAGYDIEIPTMIKQLLANGVKPESIAFFTEKDQYGQAEYQAALAVLKNAGIAHPEKLLHVTYERNTLNVEGAVEGVLVQDIYPDVFIITGGYAPVARFIKLIKENLNDTVFLTISFVDPVVLTSALNGQDGNVITTGVVPYLNSDLPAINEYKTDIKKYNKDAELSYASLEGYLIAKLFVMGLKQSIADGKLSREGIIDSFEKMKNIDLGIGSNSRISFSKTNHQALQTLWPSILKDHHPVPFDWKSISKMVKKKELD